MTPMEAYSVISRAMTELTQIRQRLYPKGQGWSKDETMAQVIAFEALRRIQENEEKNDSKRISEQDTNI